MTAAGAEGAPSPPARPGSEGTPSLPATPGSEGTASPLATPGSEGTPPPLVEPPANAVSRRVETTRLEAACRTVAAETFDAIERALDDCDDRTVNASPRPGTVNSVFALVAHLDGVIADWGGNLVAGEDIPRDRAAEFTASGTVEQARALLARMRERLPGYLHRALTEGIAKPRVLSSTRTDAAAATPEFVVLHLLRELTQHTGQLQICRDLVASRR